MAKKVVTEVTEVVEKVTPVAAPVVADKADLAAAVTNEAYARLVNTKQLKALIKTAGLRMAGDLPAALVLEVGKLVDKAAGRCVADKRATIQPQDL